MKFKIDENLGERTTAALRQRGHDAETVRDEQMGGADDHKLFDICVHEQRCLVTLDLDFSDVLRFDATRSAGIAVLRYKPRGGWAMLQHLVAVLLAGIEKESITGKLWIVESGRIRVHQRSVSEEI